MSLILGGVVRPATRSTADLREEASALLLDLLRQIITLDLIHFDGDDLAGRWKISSSEHVEEEAASVLEIDDLNLSLNEGECCSYSIDESLTQEKMREFLKIEVKVDDDVNTCTNS